MSARGRSISRWRNVSVPWCSSSVFRAFRGFRGYKRQRSGNHHYTEGTEKRGNDSNFKIDAIRSDRLRSFTFYHFF